MAKSCYIKYKDGSLEVKAPNGAPSLLFEKAKAAIENNEEYAKKIKGSTKEEKALQLWAYLTQQELDQRDLNGEPNFSVNTLGTKETNVVLDNLWATLSAKGVKKVSLDTYKIQFKDKNGYELDAQGLSDALNGIIAFVDGDTKTATEEMTHMFTATQMETPEFKSLLTSVSRQPGFQEIYDEYITKPEYNDRLARKEVVDKMIRDVLLDNTTESLTQSFLRKAREIIRKATGLFKDQAIRDYALKLKAQLRKGSLNVQQEFEPMVQFELGFDVPNFDVGGAVEDLVMSLEKKKEFSNQKNERTKAFEIDKKIEKIALNAQADNEKVAAIRAMNIVTQVLDEGMEILRVPKDASPEVAATALRNARQKISLFQDFINQINQPRIFDKMPERVQNEVARIVRMSNTFESRYENIELALAEKLMSPFKRLMKHFKAGDYRKLLQETRDINFFTAFTQALGDVNDDVLKLFDLYYKKARQLVINNTKDDSEELMRLRSKIENYDDLKFIQKDDSGELSRYFVNAENINFAAFYSAQNKFINDLRQNYGVPQDEKARKEWFNDPKNKEASQNYNKERKKWLRENEEAIDNVDEIINANISRAITDIFSKPDDKLERLLVKAFKAEEYDTGQYFSKEFILENYSDADATTKEKIDTVIYSTKRFILENSFREDDKMYFQKKLAKPKAEKYYDDSYAKLSKAERAYLDKVLEIKRKSLKLPVSPRLIYKIPQMRKTFVNRLQEGDFKGMATNFMDRFRINEDESEYGQLDGDKSVERVIPVYFTNNVPREDMSTDILLLSNSFNYMANHYIEMRKIEASVLLMEDVIGRRKIQGKEALTGGKKAELLSMYIDRNVYGRQKANEGQGGKILDFLGSYASLLGLGFNIYSPTANVLQAYSSIAQEKASGIYDKKAFKEANSFYTTHLSDSVKAYQDPSVDSALTGIGRLFNIRDEFMSQVIKNSPSEKTAIKRIVSSPYSLNNIGEHYGAYKMALTILANEKVLKDGKEVSLLSVIEHKDFTSFVPDDVTNLDGSKVDVDALSLRIHDVNQRLYGIYNDVDQNQLQHYALGRLIMTFRKFIFAPGNRKWGNLQRNYQQGGILQEGMYMSMWRILTDARALVRKDKFDSLTGALADRWKNMDDVQRKNWLRTRREIATIAGAFAVFMALSAAMSEDDDDAMNVALAYAAYQARRHVTEMSFFFNPLETLTILRSPAAAVDVVEKVLTLPQIIDAGQFIEEGNPLRKYQDGSYYLPKKAGDLIPMYKGLRNATDVIGLYELRTK